MFLPIINLPYFRVVILLNHDNYFINKKINVFFIIELKHREPTVFDQGIPQPRLSTAPGLGFFEWSPEGL